jgi:hypothetical protein
MMSLFFLLYIVRMSVNIFSLFYLQTYKILHITWKFYIKFTINNKKSNFV